MVSLSCVSSAQGGAHQDPSSAFALECDALQTLCGCVMATLFSLPKEEWVSIRVAADAAVVLRCRQDNALLDCHKAYVRGCDNWECS